ncbi:hypothetical protein RB195_002720 [Necator americanus]|uniref:Potassium channel domain-containing protein n=1 Tax=Necator americanus TaxID=51031 RepID=A0ABR1DN74_NECAM
MKGVLKRASTVAVHIALILGVSVYTLFGAVTMLTLESPERVRAQNRRDVKGEERDVFTRVYLGSEIAAMDPGYKKATAVRLTRINSSQALIRGTEIASVPVTSEVKELDVPTVEQEIKADVEKWSFGNSLIFAFTVITTIGLKRRYTIMDLDSHESIWLQVYSNIMGLH